MPKDTPQVDHKAVADRLLEWAGDPTKASDAELADLPVEVEWLNDDSPVLTLAGLEQHHVLALLGAIRSGAASEDDDLPEALNCLRASLPDVALAGGKDQVSDQAKVPTTSPGSRSHPSGWVACSCPSSKRTPA